MNRTKISTFLRRSRLLHTANAIYYLMDKWKNRNVNASFLKENPSIPLPPDYLMFESFQLNYFKYYNEGKEAAIWLTDLIAKYKTLNDISILDWGCGPARVLRHLPEVIPGNHYFGTDYNHASIQWNKEHLKGIEFNLNSLEAKLPYPDASMDVIYGISIFTHLSEQAHYDWFNELYRVLKPNGIMLITTQGDGFIQKLTEEEKHQYEAGHLVIRGKVKEGHRTYSAYHPTAFMKKLIKDAKVEEHLVRPTEKGRAIPQDVWILRKT